jgi:uncharacterized damage-inducible protein DinB
MMVAKDAMNRCQRTEPSAAASESEMSLAFLNRQRDTLLCKLEGLDDEQLRRPHTPSGLTLLGLVKHLTDVERSWFREGFAGEDLAYLWDDADPQRYWRVKPDDTTVELIAGYREECRIADRIVQEHALDDLSSGGGPAAGQAITLRWIVLHMIEETARHVGHADLIREAIDGQTGE